MYFTDIENFKSSTGYDIAGVWYPRVTSIVSIKAKPALYKYYAGLPSFAAGEAIKAKSAEEGTLLHECVEGILGGKDLPIPASVKPAVQAFRDFQNQHKIIAHEMETRVVSKQHHYAGTMDVLAEIDGVLGVLDIKTSLAIYRDYGIQTAAYIEALKERPTLPALVRWVLRLDQARNCIRGCGAKMRDKGGNEKIRLAKGKGSTTCVHVWGDQIGDVEFQELKGIQADTAAFLASKTLWEWEHDYWLRQIAPTAHRR